jgi:hypothetical protein
MRHLSSLLLLFPLAANAQIRYRPDPMPPKTIEWSVAGGRMLPRGGSGLRPGSITQADSLGLAPLGRVGDSVTVYLFPDGEHMRGLVHARITARRRFDPPLSWRAACDEVAHPGWVFDLAPKASASYAVAVPGFLPMPVKNEPPPLARIGARPHFMVTADSTFARYLEVTQPASPRAVEVQREDFYSLRGDAGFSRLALIGVRGPDGHRYAAFSFWLHDDYRDHRPNTTGTWIVDGWGYPVARIAGNVDIYGTVDVEKDGIDEIVTSSGLIRWDGTQWRFPAVYSEEPCLAHKVFDPPKGRGN